MICRVCHKNETSDPASVCAECHKENEKYEQWLASLDCAEDFEETAC